ncbi:hypothetical protein C6P40_004074 [Pichia californica]|uniref:EXS domain-containing protein n=1 Tax=Pichia californica TaxID=460514 RepID=A0A9P6WQL5_9ASCO|nr:hypothetical protein C6P42_001096 [[Candida] californica]KAG0690023.1 hypothetical protein C6P40_004074 [[Candida] californica]
MKFGDFIENHLVPEWRSQYLDYFKGKTKLKKLEKFLETSTECQCSSNSLNNFENELNNSSDLHSIFNGNPDINNKNRTDYQFHNLGDFSISDSNKCDNNNNHSSDDEVEDDFKVVSLIDRLNYKSFEKNNNNESIPLLKSGLRIPYTKDNKLINPNNNIIEHHRSRSTSILYIRDKRASLTEGHKDLVDLAKNKYLDWVDIELFKVDTFYKHKEIECTTRFVILLDQLEQLKLHESKFNLIDTNLQSQQQDCVHHGTNSTKNRSCVSLIKPSKYFSTVSILERVHFIFNYFEMPTLPNFFWKKNNDDPPFDSNSIVNSNNFSNKEHDSPPFFISKIMIKKAICELYHTIELLNSFRVVNRTAFRKIVKKYDKRCHDSKLSNYMKKVDSMYFNSSDTLHKLTDNLENIFTSYFEDGHRKTAITKLRSFATVKSHYRSNFFSGYLIGVSCPFLIFFILDVYNRSHSGNYPDEKYILQLWGSWFLFILAGLLFSLNCVVWDKYKINYKLVFELNPNDALDYKQFLIIPSTLLFIGTLLAYFSSSHWLYYLFDFRYFPYIYFYCLLFILLCPFKIFYLKARIWFIVSIFRLFLSGFYPVEFRDFFMGVITCSLTYSIANIYMLFCLENQNWNNCISCGPMKSYVLGICACIPPIWRAMQCLRRFLDTGEWFPHFANLAKYLITTLYFFTLSIYRISTFRDIALYGKSSNIFITAFFITVSIINSSYSSFWDICMDWSLMQPSSDNFLLRDVLIYKYKWIYYSAILFDIVLRFQWIVYVFTPYSISHSALTAFFVAIAELIRRFVWMFFRMENEHATNVNLFRVSRVCQLPYSYNDNSIINSKGIQEFVKDSLDLNVKNLFKGNNNNNSLPFVDVEELEDNLNNQSNHSVNIQNSNNVHSSYQPDLESNTSLRDANDILVHDNDVVSIYSTATQRTEYSLPKPSGWQHLSRIISRAHTKEFQQRNNGNNNNNNNVGHKSSDDVYDFEEELNLVDDTNGENALIDDNDDDYDNYNNEYTS